MVDRNNAPQNTSGHETFKEAVCIDVARVYDSCSDKDCLEDLRVHFNGTDQVKVNNAFSVKTHDAEIKKVYIDVEPVQFNRGFYSVDITICFDVAVELFNAPCNRTATPPSIVEGVAVFNKRVILYGSEGNVKIFTSGRPTDDNHRERELPKAVVEAVDPVFLAARLIDADCTCECDHMPDGIGQQPGDPPVDEEKIVLVTLGLFSIVKLERNVQMLVPAYDFCIPDKECESTSSDPCSLFKNIKFPIDEFFPPRFGGSIDPANAPDCGCGAVNHN